MRRILLIRADFSGFRHEHQLPLPGHWIRRAAGHDARRRDGRQPEKIAAR